MKRMIVLCLAGGVLALVPAVKAETISLASAPPVVVRTVPAAGATDVDPGLTEIKATYSKAMQNGSWSWCWWERKDDYPEMTGDPRYLQDSRTCVLPVKLQPNKFYAIWLNTEKLKNFTDTSGRPAVPYLLTFFTGSVNEKSTTVGRHLPKEVAAYAVYTISQCAEGDPRVEEALAKLRAAPQEGLVASLASYLESSKATVRRSAIYVLQNGGFADITPAVAPLQKLLAHKEDLTRGMAALALGQNHVSESFESIAKMAKDDTSGYARRCAAYALGLLGNPQAEPVLEAVLEDPEALVRNNAKAALAMIEAQKNRQAAAYEKPGASRDFSRLLNGDQRAVLEWTDRQFHSFFDERTFAGWSDKERTDLETRLIDSLKGPRNTEYYQAINTLAALHSTKALSALREIAYDRREKDNRDRWMAIRAIGMVGDKSDVPELIPLVYHGNSNTRWWAQISLVRLTGQNFGKDWNAWGKWWNDDQHGQPPYKPEIIRWWSGQTEPDKLAETLADSDSKFLQSIKPKASRRGATEERSQAGGGEQYLQQQLKQAEAGNYWAKFRLWEAYSKGKHDVDKNSAKADRWLSELVKGAYLAKFEPVNGFAPKTPQEMLANFNESCRLFSGQDSLGGASFFRTTKQGDKLIGSFLTETPDEFKAALDKNSDLKLISMDKVTPKMFLAHESAKQESL